MVLAMVQIATLKEEAGHARTLPVTGPEGCLVTSSEGSVEVALSKHSLWVWRGGPRRRDDSSHGCGCPRTNCLRTRYELVVFPRVRCCTSL